MTINGVASETLTKAQQEVLESKHMLYASDGVMKGRLLASVQVIGYQDCFIHANRAMQWGVVRSPSHDFLVPDCFEDMMIVPVSPRMAIVADMPDRFLTDDQVAVINQTEFLLCSTSRNCPHHYRSTASAFR